MMKGEVEEAIPHFEKALSLNPALADAHYFLGVALYYFRGEATAALAHWREVLRLDPNSVATLNQVAHVLAACPDASIRNGAQAVELAERARQISGGQDPALLDTLAAAYAEAGRFLDAIATARQALTLASQRNNPRLVDALNAHLAL